MVVGKRSPAMIEKNEGYPRFIYELSEAIGAGAESYTGSADQQRLFGVVDYIRRCFQVGIVGVNRVFPRGSLGHWRQGLINLYIEDIGRQLQ
jgi:hypothetical protein